MTTTTYQIKTEEEFQKRLTELNQAIDNQTNFVNQQTAALHQLHGAKQEVVHQLAILQKAMSAPTAITDFDKMSIGNPSRKRKKRH